MKPFLLACLLFPMTVNGQSTEPFKQANLILVTFDTLSVERAFILVGKSLIDQGYTLDKTDATFQTIQTNKKMVKSAFGKSSVGIVVTASIKTVTQNKTEVKLSGVGYANDFSSEITYRGQQGSFYRVGFELLQDTAKAIANVNVGRITYAFQ